MKEDKGAVQDLMSTNKAGDDCSKVKKDWETMN